MDAPAGPVVADATLADRPLEGRRVCMFVFNDVRRDARVQKEARSLAESGAEVTIVARGTEDEPAERWLPTVRIVRVASRTRRVLGDRGSGTAGSIRRSPMAFLRRQVARGPRRLAAISAHRLWSSVNGFLVRRSRWWPLLNSLAGWYRRSRAQVPAADVYHAHDLNTLVPAWLHARRHRSSLVYDSHELYLEAGWMSSARGPTWRLIHAIEGVLARRAAAVVTVNSSIARELQRRHHLAVAPTVVMNCPPRWRPEVAVLPEYDHFRRTAGLPIPAERPIILYQGALLPGRGIEPFVAALETPELASVTGALLGWGSLQPWLVEQCRKPLLQGRLFVLDGVANDVLLEWTASADVCMAVIEPTTLNNRYSTPNKLFEALAAGRPFVSSDLPERRAIVERWRCGALCEDASPASIARAVRALLDASPEERLAMRRRCREAALTRYCWEIEGGRLLDLYGQVAGAR